MKPKFPTGPIVGHHLISILFAPSLQEVGPSMGDMVLKAVSEAILGRWHAICHVARGTEIPSTFTTPSTFTLLRLKSFSIF